MTIPHAPSEQTSFASLLVIACYGIACSGNPNIPRCKPTARGSYYMYIVHVLSKLLFISRCMKPAAKFLNGLLT